MTNLADVLARYPRHSEENVLQLVARAVKEFELTELEGKELRLLLAGYECKESAVELRCASDTSRQRRKAIYRKTGQTGAGKVVALVVGVRMPAKVES